MFIFHTALSLGFLALVAATFLYTWAAHNKGHGSCFAKFIAIIVIILSIGSIACTYYCGMQCWKNGGFEKRMEMRGMMMHEKKMDR